MATSDYYVDSFDRLHDDVAKWCADAAASLAEAGIKTIECRNFIESTQKNIAVLSLDDFLNFCEISRQSVVFIHYAPSDIDDYVELYISRACKEDELATSLIEFFKREHASTIESVRKAAGKYKYAELISSVNGITVTTGAICEAHEEFLDLLSDFSDKIESEQKNLRLAESEEAAENMLELAKELASDGSFLALKGKRKRCIYVQEKYGGRIISSGKFRRPDLNSELMDSNLVDLVEKVSDKIAIDGALSSAKLTSE